MNPWGHQSHIQTPRSCLAPCSGPLCIPGFGSILEQGPLPSLSPACGCSQLQSGFGPGTQISRGLSSAGMKGQGRAVGLGSRLGSLPCTPWGGCSSCATFSSPVTCHLGNVPPVPLWGWGHPAQCPPKGDTKGWVTTGTPWPFGVTSSPPPAHQPRSGPRWEGRGRKICVAPLRN